MYAFPRFEHWPREKTEFKYFIDNLSENMRDYSTMSEHEKKTVEVLLD